MDTATVPMRFSRRAERDRRLQEILLQAVDHPAEERRKIMLDLGYDADLVNEAVTLLAEEDVRFLAGPSGQPAPDVDAYFPSIPGYRIERQIGEGGMGRVFLAREEGDTGRLVAIKMMRPVMKGAELDRRFAAERQALARLNHPSIAQLYGADCTPDGQPFVVMEYVDGEPLTAYCDRHRLGLEARLRLFLTACRGVEHAHRRLLLHRDLKPPNLLVTERDGERLTKVIDFGIAKTLDVATEGVAVTLAGAAAPGTPAYMSPEALEPVDENRDLDTRTDVYSLGVVLYELLVGARPHAGTTHDPLLPSRILKEDPESPSVRWRSLDEKTRRRLAAARGHGVSDLESALGCLDWIALKAIARDRDHRYGSVGELADDLERHLRHEPTAAHPPSLRYRLTCLVRRHRPTVIAASLVVFSLILGAFGATLGMLKAREAEKLARAEALRASREAETSTRVSDLLVDLFEVADPNRGAHGRQMELGELLDRGFASVRERLDEDPAIQARLLTSLGEIYRGLGDYPRSRELLDEALALWNEAPDPDPHRLGQTLNHLAVLDRNVGRYEDAADRLQRASVLWTEHFGADDPRVAGLLNNQGNVLQHLGRYEEAAEALGRALEIWQDSGAEARSIAIAALN
ncbi:MAG: serine/threonine-protein kinase, partial [Acidobacteriota bacterium]